jgi:hypothetical protein
MFQWQNGKTCGAGNTQMSKAELADARVFTTLDAKKASGS